MVAPVLRKVHSGREPSFQILFSEKFSVKGVRGAGECVPSRFARHSACRSAVCLAVRLAACSAVYAAECRHTAVRTTLCT